MRDILNEYGGVILVFLMGMGFITGLGIIFQTVMHGWIV